MHKIEDKLKEKKGIGKDGLAKIPNEKVEDYIEYYEKLIRKKVNSNISKVRDQALKNIQNKHKKNVGNARAKTLDKRLEEIRAFYEGDIIKMDTAQKDCKDSKKKVKWHQWDMVMILPNPDYYEGEDHLDGEGEEAGEEAKSIYSKCFKKSLADDVEAKKERDRELKLVKDIAMTKLMKDNRILDKGGKRFRPVEELENEKNTGNVVHEGGENKKEDSDTDGLNLDKLADMVIDAQDDEEFFDTRMYLSDFSNLILNAIIYKLNKILGFETLLLISKSGEDLYLMIRASDGDLSVHAQNQGYLLSLEVGYTDIETQPPFSLGKSFYNQI